MTPCPSIPEHRAQVTPNPFWKAVRPVVPVEAVVGYPIVTPWTPADYAELAPLILAYASAKDPLAVAIVEEAADAAVRIIERLMDAGSPAISLVGGLAEPLTPWLPSRIRELLTTAQSDPLDGAILMARRAFFGLARVPQHHVDMQPYEATVRRGGQA